MVDMTTQPIAQPKFKRGRRVTFPPIFKVPESPHPLFQLERRRIPWGRTPERARRHSRRLILRLSTILLVLWIVAVLLIGSNSLGVYQWFLATGADLMIWFFIATLGLSGITDFIAIAYSMNSISREHNLGRWDLLRLSSSEGRVLEAKYTLARLRTWRVYAFMVGLRLTLLLMILVQLTLFYWLENGETWFTGDLLYALQFDPVPTLLALVAVLLFLIGYLLEPYWRFRGVVAMGVALSTFVRQVSTAATFGFFLIIGMWITQVILLGLYAYSYIVVMESLSTFIYSYNGYYDDGFLWVGMLLVYFIGAIFIIQLFYRLLGGFALGRALRRLERAR